MPTMSMNDSEIGDDWIREMVEAVPIAYAGDEGQEIITGPVRMSFPHLFAPKPKKKATDRSVYGASLLFPPIAAIGEISEENAVLGPINETIWNLVEASFPNHIVRGRAPGLKVAVRDQGENERYGGFTPGAMFMNAGNTLQPALVDTNSEPLSEALREQVRPGFWAICSVSFYPFNNDGKGVACSLNSVMFLAPDKVLGGAPLKPKTAFSSVKVPAKLKKPAIKTPGAFAAGGKKAPRRDEPDSDVNDLL